MNDLGMIKNYLEEFGIHCDADYDFSGFDESVYKKIDPSLAAKIDSVLQNIPEILLGGQKTGTYKVVYDQGLGTLQRAKDEYAGYLRANIVKYGTNNEITGSALLQELSMGPQIVSGVFSAMSMVTGQYYMSQINTQLEKVDRNIEEIQKFLEDDKRSRMESDEEFLRSICISFQSIMQNDSMRQAKLNSIQDIKRNSCADIIFYKKQIDDLRRINVKEDKAETVIENIQKITHWISEYWYSLYLYCFASSIEPVVAKEYDSLYLENVKADIALKCEQYKADYKSWKTALQEYISKAKAFDESKVLRALKTVSENKVYIGKLALWQTLIGGAAELADKVDKKIKNDKQGKAFEELNIMDLCADTSAIEEKKDDMMLFDVLNNGRVELIKHEGAMYLKTSKPQVIASEFEVYDH